MSRLIPYHLVVLLLTLLWTSAASTLAQDKAPPKPLKTENMWKGSVGDMDLLKKAPAPDVITDAKALEDLYKAWNLGDKLPEVDFKTELVLVATTRGSGLGLNALLDDKGDLTTRGLATADIRPGFRYVLISVKKEGVESIKGVPLKE